MNDMVQDRDDPRQRYLRPIKLSIAFSVLAELTILILFGLVLPASTDHILHKFLWTVIFCGFGMGATGGAIIDLLVVDRWWGTTAVVATAVISTVVLGLGCNSLCLGLDMGLDFFGGKAHPVLFLVNGVLMAALGGTAVGFLLFTEKGRGFFRRKRPSER